MGMDGKICTKTKAMDLKLFWAFNNDQEKDKKKKHNKKRKSSAGETSNNSTISQEKQHFSLREIMNLAVKDLQARIFVFDEKNTGKDLTKLKEGCVDQKI